MTPEHGQRLKLHALLIMFSKLLNFAFKIYLDIKNKTIPLRTRRKYRSRSQIRPETGVRQSRSRSTGAAPEISVKFLILILSISMNSLNIKMQYMT